MNTSTTDTTPTAIARRRHWWALDPGGSIGGLFLAILSVTPSLLPRPSLFQGAIAAIAFGLGYMLGVAVWAILRRFMPWRPSRTAQRALWIVYALLWLVALGALSVLSFAWQNEVRSLVEMPPLLGIDVAAFLLGFLPVAVLLVTIGKGVRRLHHALRRTSGAVVGLLGTLTVVAAALGALVLAVMIAVDGIYLNLNGDAEADAVQPASTYRSAGVESAIGWDTLGRHGANFVAGGPTASEIEAVTGEAALEPIRVYAGLESAPTASERAALVVAELERTGAFERSVLVVATTTGSGWLEPQTVDALEYLHAGDTAIAALQYAYTPSWVSFLFDADAPVEAAGSLFDAVYEHWIQLPEDDRPMLITYGLSLGAHGSQALFDDIDDVRARTDGALFVGSPNGSELWRTLQASRDQGSPAWQPVLNDGSQVRWLSKLGDEQALTGEWSEPRVLYLQHATDPVTWLGPELIWSQPEWLDADQRGADVSPSMRWIPGVTAVQVAIDMLMGESVPARHGHNFGDVITTGWREVTGDAGLDAAAIARIQAIIEAMSVESD
ncbi:alpha/beta hydrolase [Microbacterium sp. A84]|uniref:alpha/beta hydrolase n=1 Tax=Microbacterium sp. A84 TaxID=3450715 RepID=UPI003F43EF05